MLNLRSDLQCSEFTHHTKLGLRQIYSVHRQVGTYMRHHSYADFRSCASGATVSSVVGSRLCLKLAIIIIDASFCVLLACLGLCCQGSSLAWHSPTWRNLASPNQNTQLRMSIRTLQSLDPERQDHLFLASLQNWEFRIFPMQNH